jgi:hypothetical protein
MGTCARIRGVIICRRSPRQSIAHLIRLRSKLTRRPAPRILPLGFRARGIALQDTTKFLLSSLHLNPFEMLLAAEAYGMINYDLGRTIRKEKRQCRFGKAPLERR